ncbi:TPA: RNA polymerase sigma factor RpoD, partial [Burkholderia multivorans]|nr:RNA polymerase sigma factor RpoD [Burkholderia multivorans]HDR9414006.1 RNA polymerase sigma factor RpoD [Burkholderia multivorans]
MAKTTGGKKATGKGSTEPTKKVTAAKSASSARTTSSATSTPAGKKTAAGTAQAAPAPTARTRAAARPDSGPAKPAAKRASAKSARDAAAAADETAVRTTHAPTVQPAVVQQPRVDIAGTANSMTKKLNEVSVDDDANQSDEQPATAAAPGKSKARDRRAKEKALLKEAFATSTPGTAEELEERRVKLRALIKLGKERGFLTYAEINDHLPDNFTETEALEGIIGTFNDMGVAVYEQAPDAETLLLNDNAPAASSDDEVEEEAEVALSTVDSEFGRTTDPVRMYMREMGTVELLTREGEIEIAKRIEDGLRHMVMAISACPTTIADILAMAERVANDEIRVDE